MRTILDNKECATEIINKVLVNEIEPEEIEKYNSSYITSTLKNRECDIVYKLKNKDIFFLIEHQTKIDYKMALRMYEYSLEIRRSAIKGKEMNNKKIEIPAVIPIVLYTGNKKWNAKRGVSEIQAKLLGYNEEIDRYNVVDVNDYTKEELLEGKTFITKAMLIEKINDTEKLKPVVIEISKRIKNEEEQELLEKMATVILGNSMPKEKIEEFIKKLRRGDDSMLAIVDTIIEERKRERILGRKKGKKEGIMQIVKSMIEEQLPISLISKITKLDEKEIEKIEKNT